MYLSFWPLCFLFVFNIRIPITPLVSSDSAGSSMNNYARFNNRANILIPNMFFVESHDRFWLETISTSPKGHNFSRSSRWWSVARHNFTNNLSFYMWQSSEWVLIIYHQLSIFSATCISLWREQVNFQWFDGEVRFVLD